MQCVTAVRFIAVSFGRDGYIDVVVLCTKPATMLILLDARDIDEKRNPGYVVEL